ncbi:putative Survival motor neuron-like protein 1 [Drepanopeziza brunnea f. sp. 'multigermtubi' MB_m1]|uniref:Putative Survival motor neuron-like protein 1 n=1 Tax=Marssonina brunnea f. sp. multigermtubi (strain MB_m1) TaxID=1072389 RepID=K1WN94_MARBU|nr:putative Survival motor neuron-like protein 1 [Drepanopeziza brunnea f. sp. 'multigermtubi' MB_m1]EKD13802.1 putative Survival motor neuron-like protein 1 [Drepanopeziza brunnea f. sp. 'multigermtubi' MB_m1]
MAANGDASQAQIWDDSALVESWNGALEEYKKYHSLKARGENIEQVLKETEDGSNQLDESMYYEGGGLDQDPARDLQADREASEKIDDLEITSRDGRVPVTEKSNASNGPALPQHLIGQVHDEGLKNLLMSWYYAGYYTGLYEGQKNAGMSAKHES